MERYKPLIAKALTQAIKSAAENSTAEIEIAPQDIETPPDRTLGDFAFPCFRLAKAARKAPPIIAKEIADRLNGELASKLPAGTFTISTAGPYVNFMLSTQSGVDSILKEIISTEDYAKLPQKSREKWVFEFSSPNVAKPFQIYHLRTTIVGSSLSKIAKLRGYDVTTINHLGDWGTQYGKLTIALKKYADKIPETPTLADLVEVYIQIHKDMETDPSLAVAGQEAFLKLEQGDPEIRALWKKCVDISVKEFKKTYARYQVEFDHYWGESFYEEQLRPLMKALKDTGVAKLDQGAWIVPVTNRDGKEIPPCIIEKSDGASIYATRDLAAAIYRHEKFAFDRMSYVVGKEQQLHFEQVFGALRAMGKKWEPSCEHIATGLYRFKDSKMSTRKGNFVTLEEVNAICLEKARALMKERGSLSHDAIETIAEQVTIGAIVFADLSVDPTKDLEFDVERVISFEGETGPYLQYAHTRCLSILRKSEVKPKTLTEATAHVANLCTTPEEINLLKQLGRYPMALERTLDHRKPSHLVSYLIDLTRDFGGFYRECKVMDPENEALTHARLTLVEATRKLLSQGLDLLGIPKPEHM